MSPQGVETKLVDEFLIESRKNRRYKYVRLVFMVLMGLFFFLMSFDTNTERYTKKIYQTATFTPGSGESAGIAIIPIRGIIVGSVLNGDSKSGGLFTRGESNMVADIRETFTALEKEKNLDAVVLFINSPGGTVGASDAIYRYIAGWKKKTGKRVIAYFDSVAASGGYYVAQAADEITASPDSITGSIGVIFSMFNFADIANTLGVKENVIKSGKFKDIGSGFRNISTEEKTIFQALIDETYVRFLSVVAEGRKGKLTMPQIHTLADGRIYSGMQAKNTKLVDHTGTFDEMLGYEFDRIKKSKRYGSAKAVIFQKSSSAFKGLLSGISTTAKIPFLDREGYGSRLMYLWVGGR